MSDPLFDGGCDPQPEWSKELDRLRAELVNAQQVATNLRGELNVVNDHLDDVIARAEKAEARLAAVIALCDDDFLWPEGHRIQDTVRAAATKDPAAGVGLREHGPDGSGVDGTVAGNPPAAALRDAWQEGHGDCAWCRDVTDDRLLPECRNPYTQGDPG